MSAKTLNIPADGSHAQATLGRYQYGFVRFLSKPAEISFDGNQWQAVSQNDRFTLPQIPTRVFFRASGGLASIVTFQYSMTPFSAQDTAVTPAATVVIGNLGIANGAAAAGGLPACDNNGYLQITNGMQLVIPGTLNGGQRQKIIFSMGTDGAALNVADENGFSFMTVRLSQNIIFDTSATFIVSGQIGTSHVTIGQIFNA